MAERITGQIDCDEACQVPDGVALVEVPMPRHAWGDVFVCPNDGCDRAFLNVSLDVTAPEVASRG